MSGGPDGSIQTPADAETVCFETAIPPAVPAAIPNCDDIGTRIK